MKSELASLQQFLLSTLSSFQGVLKVSSCSSIGFNPCRGGWQVSIFSWSMLSHRFHSLNRSFHSKIKSWDNCRYMSSWGVTPLPQNLFLVYSAPFLSSRSPQICFPVQLADLSAGTTLCQGLSVPICEMGICYMLSHFQSCLTLREPMDCSTLGFPVLHHFPEFAQTYVHWISDAIQSSHPLSPPSSALMGLLFQKSGSWLWSFSFTHQPHHSSLIKSGKTFKRKFPGGPVVRTLAFTAQGVRSHRPWLQNKAFQIKLFILWMWVFITPLHTPPTLLCLPVLLPFEMGAHMESQSSDKIIFNP